ncbi:DUF397 domain-containing protein [Thermobifida cellulosilytica]
MSRKVQMESLTLWRKSSYSTNTGACVEVAETARAVLVRDTQHRELGHLAFTPGEWAAFLAEVRAGRL